MRPVQCNTLQPDLSSKIPDPPEGHSKAKPHPTGIRRAVKKEIINCLSQRQSQRRAMSLEREDGVASDAKEIGRDGPRTLCHTQCRRLNAAACIQFQSAIMLNEKFHGEKVWGNEFQASRFGGRGRGWNKVSLFSRQLGLF